MVYKQFLFQLIFLATGLALIAGLGGCSAVLENTSATIGSAAMKEDAADPLGDDLHPNPNLSPEDVVNIQVEALQHNDRQDRGIAVTFRFASPDNKTVTGPLNRFIRLVKNPAYRPMLNHKRAEFAPIQMKGDVAQQKVTIVTQDGQTVVYLWELSKQDLPACRGCWMTDSVTLVPTRRQDLKGI